MYEIAKDPKYYGNQRDLASMVYKFFDKKTARQWCQVYTSKRTIG